jgi:hypothetical protein
LHDSVAPSLTSAEKPAERRYTATISHHLYHFDARWRVVGKAYTENAPMTQEETGAAKLRVP